MASVSTNGGTRLKREHGPLPAIEMVSCLMRDCENSTFARKGTQGHFEKFST